MVGGVRTGRYLLLSSDEPEWGSEAIGPLGSSDWADSPARGPPPRASAVVRRTLVSSEYGLLDLEIPFLQLSLLTLVRVRCTVAEPRLEILADRGQLKSHGFGHLEGRGRVTAVLSNPTDIDHLVALSLTGPPVRAVTARVSTRSTSCLIADCITHIALKMR